MFWWCCVSSAWFIAYAASALHQHHMNSASLSRWQVPMAPALGLLLHECIYDSYNKRWGEGRELLRLADWSAQVDAFKVSRLWGRNVGWCACIPRAEVTVPKASIVYGLCLGICLWGASWRKVGTGPVSWAQEEQIYPEVAACEAREQIIASWLRGLHEDQFRFSQWAASRRVEASHPRC